MKFKQSTFEEIIESEREMFLNATDRYGDFFVNASEFNVLLNEFIKSVDPDRYIFVMFLSQMRKHATLALLSSVRLHRIQSMMNLRQVLEAGASAAYAIAHTNQGDFAEVNKDGILEASQNLTNKRYRWLDENYSDKSIFIRNMKNSINSSSAHSNIIYAHGNFKFEESVKKFSTPFFDIENDYWIKTDLWMIANVMMGIMDLFYGVNKDRNVLKFIDQFSSRLKALEEENHKLKALMMETDRYKAVKK